MSRHVSKIEQPVLPFELFRSIIEHAFVDNAPGQSSSNSSAKGTMFSLLCVSRAIHYEAERIIYRNLPILNMPVDIGLQVLHLLSTNSQIASHVHELSVPMYRHSYQVNTLGAALGAVDNLKVLTVQSGLGIDCRIFSIFSKCEFQLHTLTLRGDPDDDIWAFIEKQTTIINFSYFSMGVCDAPDFNPDVLPRLSTLEGNPNLIASLLSPAARRPVARLKITLGNSQSPTSSFLHPPSLTIWPLQSLCIDFRDRPTDLSILEGFTDCRNLQYLEIIPSNFLYLRTDAIVRVLSNLKALRKIRLGATWEDDQAGSTLARTLFNNLESLEIVEIFIHWFARCLWTRDERSIVLEAHPDDNYEWKHILL